MMAPLAQSTLSPMCQRASELWAHVLTCTIFNASCLSWRIKIDNVCYVEHNSIGNMHAMFKQQHWKYNLENAPTYERKRGIDLVWNDNMVCICSILKQLFSTLKRTPAWLLQCVVHYIHPNDGRHDFFYQVATGYWDKVHN